MFTDNKLAELGASRKTAWKVSTKLYRDGKSGSNNAAEVDSLSVLRCKLLSDLSNV